MTYSNYEVPPDSPPEWGHITIKTSNGNNKITLEQASSEIKKVVKTTQKIQKTIIKFNTNYSRGVSLSNSGLEVLNRCFNCGNTGTIQFVDNIAQNNRYFQCGHCGAVYSTSNGKGITTDNVLEIIKKNVNINTDYKTWIKQVTDGIASEFISSTVKQIGSQTEPVQIESYYENSNNNDDNSDGYGKDSVASEGSGVLAGDDTFEDVIKKICSAADVLFICKRSTVVITDIESLFAEAQYLRDNHTETASKEDFNLWQLEDGSYNLDVSQYGFYTTVKVNYKGGSVKESYTDLVKIFGEIVKEYDEPTLGFKDARIKAKSYLAAHIRDFQMEMQARIMLNNPIDIGDIITLENPQTMRDQIHLNNDETKELYFVSQYTLDCDGSYISADLTLQFGPENPDDPEVSELGAEYDKENNNEEETEEGMNGVEVKITKGADGSSGKQTGAIISTELSSCICGLDGTKSDELHQFRWKCPCCDSEKKISPIEYNGTVALKCEECGAIFCGRHGYSINKAEKRKLTEI